MKTNSKLMHVALWATQLLLAFTLLSGGLVKLFNPAMLPFGWIKEHPILNALTAILDVLAAVGLVLPMLLATRPKLTFFAALGTMALMLSAILFHVLRGEAADTGFNFFVLLLAGFVAWGRRH